MGNLYSAVEDVESGGNPLAESLKGAVGLMQITKPALDDYNNAHNTMLSMGEMTEVGANRKVGRWYLSRRIPEMLKTYRIPVTLDNVLHAYNAGIGNLRRGVMPEETRDYIEKVKSRLSGKEMTVQIKQGLGENLQRERNSGETGSNFGAAFRKARNAGEGEFAWRGGRYNTKLKGE